MHASLRVLEILESIYSEKFTKKVNYVRKHEKADKD